MNRLLPVLALLILTASAPLRAAELQDAIRAGDLEKVKTLLAATPTLLQPEAGTWTPLHEAVKAGQKPIVEFLIASKAKINAKDAGGYTPLHVAASRGDKEIAQLLVSKNASLQAVTKEGLTPLHLACQALQTDTVAVLIAARADVSVKDEEGRSPIFFAIMAVEKTVSDLGLKPGNRKEIVEMLLKKKSNPSAMDTAGNTLVKVATERGLTEIVDLLNQYGAKDIATDPTVTPPAGP